VVNALDLSQMLGDDRRLAPATLLEQFPEELAEFRSEVPVQDAVDGELAATPWRPLR